MLFREVIGQENIKERLIQTLKSGRISHAQLFAGETGWGSLALALAYSQYLFCTGDKGDDACGECPSCRKMNKLVHPDLHFIFPVVKSTKVKTPVSDEYINEWRLLLTETPYIDMEQWLSNMGADENSQPLIYTEESLNILRKLNLKSFESEYKIMIIWLPEKMKVECSNKLLKILEEPHPNTVFLMVSESPSELLNTIISRAQRINLSPIESEKLKESLIEMKRLSPDSAEEVTHISSGNWLKALRILNESEEAIYNQEKFMQLMRLCWERKMPMVNAFVSELTSLGRERQKSFLAHSVRMLRENFIKNFGEDKLVYMTKREKDFSMKFSPFIHEGNIIPLYDEFERAYFDVRRNGNGRIIFTDLCIKVMQNIRP